tara:strand:+ start:302 stop:556 length:255 start_codon:yes stop_codon:yes gene_type:complete
MNLHVFDNKLGEHEYTDFCISSTDISTPKEAIAYMYGEDTLEREAEEKKGTQYYYFGDAWVGLYKTYYNVTPEEVKVLSKFWVI